MAEHGREVLCGDGVRRRIYFAIHALSMDLDEAWKATLTQGVGSNAGVCPICEVPHEAQHDLTVCAPIRSATALREVVAKAKSLSQQRGKIGEAKSLLQEHGTYPLNVSICWFLNRSESTQLIMATFRAHSAR